MSHPASYYQDPALRGLLVYGPNANCTLALCSPLFGIYHYRPSISANAVFLAFFAIALIIHLGLGIKWRTWFYTVAIVWGCIAEILGYGGRIMLWKNPFTFTGFLMQISKFPLHNGTKIGSGELTGLVVSLYHDRTNILHRSDLRHVIENVSTPTLHKKGGHQSYMK